MSDENRCYFCGEHFPDGILHYFFDGSYMCNQCHTECLKSCSEFGYWDYNPKMYFYVGK